MVVYDYALRDTITESGPYYIINSVQLQKLLSREIQDLQSRSAAVEADLKARKAQQEEAERKGYLIRTPESTGTGFNQPEDYMEAYKRHQQAHFGISPHASATELAGQKEPWTSIATPITVEGLRFDDEKPLKDGEGGCNFRYFLTADKATTLWNRTIERVRRPYADEPEASTQAPDSTGNGAKLDNPTKALGGPPETGEGALQSTQHESTETPHGKSAKDRTAAAGSSEEPTKARPATPTIAIDLEEGTGESSSKQDQDNSKLQVPTASEHDGEEGSIEGGLELELSQIPPSQPFNLLEESLLRRDSGIEMD
ncbi:MAG: hypothetical protein Q9199_002287 [Rusavskia elegans]